MSDRIDSQQIHWVDFQLSINSDQYLRYYRGDIKWVVTRTSEGLKVRFPANLLIPHVTYNGIYGNFRLQYLASGKAVSLDRLST